MYLDANNLYGHSMMQLLLTKKHDWINLKWIRSKEKNGFSLGKNESLILNKKKYKLHCKNVKLYLELELKFEKRS